jgi:polysaccharide export outer membrane protein
VNKLPAQIIWRWTIGSLVVLFSLVLMLGCTPSVSHLTEAQAAAAAVATPDQDKYLLGPEDAIEISVWKEPDLNKQLVVRPDGKITYPLIGEVQAAGKTVKQLQEDILKRLEKFVTDAHVTVILLKAQNYKPRLCRILDHCGHKMVFGDLSPEFNSDKFPLL